MFVIFVQFGLALRCCLQFVKENAFFSELRSQTTCLACFAPLSVCALREEMSLYVAVSILS